MTDNQKRILEMLAEKKIDVDEASRLLAAIQGSPPSESRPSEDASSGKKQFKYLRVQVQPNAEGGQAAGAEHVNVRVPIALLHAGMKLTALIPSNAATHVNEALRDKGIDIDVRSFKTDDLGQLIDALCDLEVDVRNGKEKVRIYVE
jgi:Fe-S-cluster formation regulator IscX/YfhJ